MHPELLITNIFFLVEAILSLVLAVVVLNNGIRKGANNAFFTSALAVSCVEIAHVIGINSSDPYVARIAFMCNLLTVPIITFNARWVIEVIGRIETQRHVLRTFEITGMAILFFFLIFPDYFMMMPHPALYFKNYYVPGKYYLILTAYYYIVIFYLLFYLLWINRHITDYLQKNRIKYYILGMMLGYTGGLIMFYPFNIHLDPIYSILGGFYTVVFAYAILKYELWNIKVIAKQAAIYGLFITLIGFLISLASFLNVWIAARFPDFPLWIIPITSGAVAVLSGALVWRKLRSIEALKYEFVNIVTHQFRTPITRIKWAAENLKEDNQNPVSRNLLDQIDLSNRQLFELTNALLDLGTPEEKNDLYNYTQITLAALIAPVLKDFESRAKSKNITLAVHINPSIELLVNIRRMTFVIQTLLENAVNYTPENGKVTVDTSIEGHFAYFAVTDSGIGINKKDLPYIFTKFFRSGGARHSHPEGMGIGLYVAKNIIERHDGHIEVSSGGEGIGATFNVRLPMATHLKNPVLGSKPVVQNIG